MYDVDLSISIVQQYIEDELFDLPLSWDKRTFEERSYQRWSAYEICDRIMDRPFVSPSIIIERFMLEMAAYAYNSHTEQGRVIFQTAVETAKDLSLLFVY